MNAYGWSDSLFFEKHQSSPEFLPMTSSLYLAWKNIKNNVFFQVKYSLKCDICRQMDTKS